MTYYKFLFCCKLVESDVIMGIACDKIFMLLNIGLGIIVGQLPTESCTVNFGSLQLEIPYITF